MKQYFFNNPVFRLVAPAVYGVLLYLLILLINNNVQSLNEAFTTQELYVSIVLTYLSFEIVRAGILVVNRFSPPASTAVVIVVQVVATTILSTAIVLVVLMTYFRYAVGFSISGTQLTIFAAVYSVTSLLYNVMYLSHYFLHKQNSIKLKAEQQQRTVLEMEMMEYRNHINPDLLYESLENLIAVMYRDVEKAEDYIDALGTAYRYVLTNRENEMVTVGEELEAGRNILRLLNEKYTGQLKLESALGEAEMSAMLIPGSLPVIFESIIRNTIISSHEPFVIRLYMEEEYLAIETRLNDRLISHPPSEQAFERLQRSYSLYTELPLIKVKAYHQNYIKLPVLRIGEAIGAL